MGRTPHFSQSVSQFSCYLFGTGGGAISVPAQHAEIARPPFFTILGNLQFSRSHFYIVGSRRRSVFPYLQSAVPTLGKQGCENVVRHDPRKLGGANRPLFTPV